MQFTWSLPTTCHFAEHALERHGDVLARLGHRALLVTGTRGAHLSGALDDTVTLLARLGCTSTIFNEVEPNPSIATIEKGALLAREQRCDFVIGIGGGSPMDAAKAIAIGVNTPYGDATFSGEFAGPVLPIVTVPTTAGTGSEVTPYAIITDRDQGIKRSIANSAIFPQYSFLDSRYLASLSKSTMTNTVIDAFSHAAEGYLAKKANHMSDELALLAISHIGHQLPSLRRDERSPKHLDALLYASMLAGMVIAHTGTTIAHGMGYALTVHKDIDHGRANGLLFPAFLNFSLEAQPQKVATLLSRLGVDSIESFSQVFAELLGPPAALSAAELSLFTKLGAATGNVHNTIPTPTEQQIQRMLEETFA